MNHSENDWWYFVDEAQPWKQRTLGRCSSRGWLTLGQSADVRKDTDKGDRDSPEDDESNDERSGSNVPDNSRGPADFQVFPDDFFRIDANETGCHV